MRKTLALLIAGALMCATMMCAAALAQNSSAPASNQSAPQTNQAPTPAQTAAARQTPNTPRIAPGSVIPAQLTKTLDAKKAKAGDEVEAKVTEDMKSTSGDVLIPKDTKIIGKVTEAQARSKEQKQSELSIAFDHAVTKDGSSMPLPASVQAIIGQQSLNQNQNQSQAQPGGSAPMGNESVAPRGMAGGSSSSPGMPRTAAPSDVSTAPTADSQPSQSTPNITASTTGVVGIDNLTLAPPNGNEGSVVTSEKNNVKLESGTLLLLKVTQ